MKGNILLHQPRCQSVTQGVRIDLLNLTAPRDCFQANLKALGVDMRTRTGGKQQIVRIRDICVSHRVEVSHQQFAQAVRNRNLPVGGLGLGRPLDNQVRLFRGVVAEDADHGVVQGNGVRRDAEQVLVDSQRLLFQIQVGDFQSEQFAYPQPGKEVRQDGNALGLFHHLVDENRHLFRRKHPHFPLDHFRPDSPKGRIGRYLVLRHGVGKEVLQHHMMVTDALGGQAAALSVFPRPVQLFPLIILLHHVLGNAVEGHLTESIGKVRVVQVQVAGIGGGLAGGRRLVELQPFQEGVGEQGFRLGCVAQPLAFFLVEHFRRLDDRLRFFLLRRLRFLLFLRRLPLVPALFADGFGLALERLPLQAAVLVPAQRDLQDPCTVGELVKTTLPVGASPFRLRHKTTPVLCADGRRSVICGAGLIEPCVKRFFGDPILSAYHMDRELSAVNQVIGHVLSDVHDDLHVLDRQGIGFLNGPFYCEHSNPPKRRAKACSVVKVHS